MSSQIIFTFPSQHSIPTIQLIENQGIITIESHNVTITLEPLSKIICTYDKDGWGPIIDYNLQVSINNREQNPISFILLHSADDDLEESWNHLHLPLQKIASYVGCAITWDRF